LRQAGHEAQCAANPGICDLIPIRQHLDSTPLRAGLGREAVFWEVSEAASGAVTQEPADPGAFMEV
jgi:hypothetical protein